MYSERSNARMHEKGHCFRLICVIRPACLDIDGTLAQQGTFPQMTCTVGHQKLLEPAHLRRLEEDENVVRLYNKLTPSDFG